MEKSSTRGAKLNEYLGFGTKTLVIKKNTQLFHNVVLFISVFDKIPQKFKAPTLYKNTFSTNVLRSPSGLNQTQCSVEYPAAASLTINPNILYITLHPHTQTYKLITRS